MTNGLLAGSARSGGRMAKLVRNWKFWAALAGGAIVIVLLIATLSGALGSRKAEGPVEVRTPEARPGQGAVTPPPVPRATQPTAGKAVAPPVGKTPATASGVTTPASSPARPTSSTTAPASSATSPAAASQTPLAADVAAIVADAEKKEKQGELVAARTLYSQAVAKVADGAQRAAVARKAAALSERTILGPGVAPNETQAEWYEVQPGDVLANIGPRFRIPYELIKLVNGLSSDMIRAGQKLKVVKGPFRARILKGAFTIEIWLRDTLVRTCPVALGVADSTPSGTYTVKVKQKNPTFYPPPSMQGRMTVKQGGAPDNPLGSRWIGFGDHLGIHGTNEPQSIGKSVSLGCIRMHNADVEFLYDCLVQGSTVEIVD